MPMTAKDAIAYLRSRHKPPTHWIGCNFPDEKCRCSPPTQEEQAESDQAQYAIGVLERVLNGGKDYGT